MPAANKPRSSTHSQSRHSLIAKHKQGRRGAPYSGVRNVGEHTKLRRSRRLSQQAAAQVLKSFSPCADRPQQTLSKKRKADDNPYESAKKLRKAPNSDGGTDKTESIDHWCRAGHWPKHLFMMDSQRKRSLIDANSRLYALKRTPSLTRKRSFGGSAISSGEQSMDERRTTSIYKESGWEKKMELKGYYMLPDEDGPEAESLAFFESLLKREASLPKDTIFDDPYFKRWCILIRNKNEARLVQDTGSLIVPSAETLWAKSQIDIDCLGETVDECWAATIPISFETPRPQPDYALGFKSSAFSAKQLAKLEPFLGDVIDSISRFKATIDVYFPFLARESKSYLGILDIADRQNHNSMAIAVRAVADLCCIASREADIDRRILAICISHNDRSIRIYGYYPVFFMDKPIEDNYKVFRHCLVEISWLHDRWACYKFIKNLYDHWVPKHLELLCSIIDDIPEAGQDVFELQVWQHTGLSQATTESLTLEDVDEGLSDPIEVGTRLQSEATPGTSMSLSQKGKATRREPTKGRKR